MKFVNFNNRKDKYFNYFIYKIYIVIIIFYNNKTLSIDKIINIYVVDTKIFGSLFIII